MAHHLKYETHQQNNIYRSYLRRHHTAISLFHHVKGINSTQLGPYWKNNTTSFRSLAGLLTLALPGTNTLCKLSSVIVIGSTRRKRCL